MENLAPWKRQQQQGDFGRDHRILVSDTRHLLETVISGAYNAVCELNTGKGPYEGVKIEKEECIDLRTRIRSVFNSLSEPQLLNGWTQNPNESLHARLWMKFPKHKFCGACLE